MCTSFASQAGGPGWAAKCADLKLATMIASGNMRGNHAVYTQMRLLAKQAERLDSDGITRNPCVNDMPGVTRDGLHDIGFHLASLAKNKKALKAFGINPRKANIPLICQRLNHQLPNFFMSIKSDESVKEAVTKSIRNLKANGTRNFFVCFDDTVFRKGSPSKFKPLGYIYIYIIIYI